MTSWSDRVVVVTGASAGIGQAMAHSAARRGADLVLFARREDRLLEVARECRKCSPSASEPVIVAGDVASPQDLERLARRCDERFGRVHVLVNNAGRGHRNVPFDELDDREVEDVVRVNLTGAIQCARRLLPLLRKAPSATLVNVGSILSRSALPYYTIYCATKFGLAGFSDSLRFELRGSNVRVLLVCPGHTETEFFEAARMDAKAFGPIGGIRADAVAEAIARAVDRGTREIALTGWGRLGLLANKYAPWLYRAVIGSQAKRGWPEQSTPPKPVR